MTESNAWQMTGLNQSCSLIYERMAGLPCVDPRNFNQGWFFNLLQSRYIELKITTPNVNETILVEGAKGRVHLIYQAEREVKYRDTNLLLLEGGQQPITSNRSFWDFPTEEAIARTPNGALLMVNIAPFSELAFIYVPPLIEDGGKKFQAYQDPVYHDYDSLKELVALSTQGLVGWWAGSSPSNCLMHYHCMSDTIGGKKLAFVEAIQNGEFDKQNHFIQLGGVKINALQFDTIEQTIEETVRLAKFGYTSDFLFCEGKIFVFPVTPNTFSIFGVLGPDYTKVWPGRGAAERLGLSLIPSYISVDHTGIGISDNQLRISPAEFVRTFFHSMNKLFDKDAILRILEMDS